MIFAGKFRRATDGDTHGGLAIRQLVSSEARNGGKPCSIPSAALALAACGASAQNIVPDALLAVDQNRSTVVERIVNQWGDRLAASNAGIGAAELREMLSAMRSDHLLAASLAGTLEGLRDVVAKTLIPTGEGKASLLQPKALGDTSDDLVYTPVVPCRIVDTRNAGGAIGASSSRDFKVWVSSGGFTAQGGSATNCNIPANPTAVVLNITAVTPAGRATSLPTRQEAPPSPASSTTRVERMHWPTGPSCRLACRTAPISSPSPPTAPGLMR